MIRHPCVVALALFGASLAAHGAVLGIKTRPDPASIAGGAAASVAKLGNSFQDMAVGVMTAQPTPEITPETPVEVQRHTEQTTPATPTQTPDTTPPVQSAQTSNAPVPVTQSSQSNRATTPLAPALTVTSPTQMTAVVPITLAPSPALIPVVTPSAAVPLQAALPDPVQETVRVSRRPAVRPKSLEAKVAAAAPKSEKPQKTQPRGNAKKQARAGSADGKATAKANVAAPRKAAVSSKAANAAISNYPGQVMRRLARQKRPRAASKGTAVVSFAIAANGGVSRVGIAKSSGSAQLDKDAVALVRRAGPFPAPPAGAQRSFKIRIKGR